ncbi:MAG: DUF2911 domain-containing protein [Saprospiraceae bacterium]|nr:DUF2911 domain-containing protein [Saprospiraceae bacterium]
MKIFIYLSLICFCFVAKAQIVTPSPSPLAKIEQKFGIGMITLEYSRPSMKNRVVFGDLVPFGKMWRTGANKATKITFSDDVTVEGKALPKGSYAVYSIPGEASWDIIFYSDWDQPGLPRNYDMTKEVLKVSAIPELLTTTIETFTMDFNDIKNDATNLVITWENTSVAIKIKTDLDTKVLQSIDKVLAGPSPNDYYTAARYYFDSGKDLNVALGWIQKSNSADPQFWKLRTESLILARLERRDEAILVAKRSLELATAAGNEDYIKMNNESISEWSRR